MMSKYDKYSYEKVFFRRPIFSEMNVLFFKSLAITAVLSALLISVLALGFYKNYSEYKTRSEIKHTYMTQLVAYYQDAPRVEKSSRATYFQEHLVYTTTPSAEEDIVDSEFTSFVTGTAPDAISVYDEAATETVGQQDAATAAVPDVMDLGIPGMTNDYDESMLAYLPSASQTGANMQGAIDGILGAVKPVTPERTTRMQPYNTRKKAYSSNVRKLSQTLGSDVDIAEANFTDFEIIQGTRDYEETIGVVSENSGTIKPCLDRIHRKYPTLRGQFTVKFDVHPEGYTIPESIKVTDSDIKDVKILRCIKRTVRRWRNFPKVPTENGIYPMVQKFVF